MSKTPRTVAIPGAPIAAASQVDHEQDGAIGGASAGEVDAAIAQIAGSTVVDASDAEIVSDEVIALRKQLAAAQAALKAHQAQQSKQAPSMAKPVGGGAVLTDRGYVVPENYGTPQQKKA